MTELIASIPGWLLPYALLALSVVSLGLILERCYYFFFRPGSFSVESEERYLALLADNRDEARRFAEAQGHVSFVAAASLLTPAGADQDAAELAAERALRGFRRYLPTLGVISTVAPLLGLLGTVTGMIKSFRALQGSGAQNIALLAGIDEALITTALGLIIAIPALVAYNYFAARANDLIDRTVSMCRRSAGAPRT